MISKSGDRGRKGSKYLLLTGATGFVGRYLLRDLLMEGHRLAVIVRPSKKQSGQARVDEILYEWEQEMGRDLPRPVVLEGNISDDQCGLSPRDLKWVAGHCDRILHNAAVLRFHASNHADEPWRTNYNGTQNVLDLCRESGIREFHGVSTAYVCGDRPGLVLEDEVDVGQSFRNDYERSKLEAEKLIRKADFFDSITFYRPAVIAGDSRTGFTSSYHGLYLYLRLMAMLVPLVEPDENGVRHTDMMLPMRGDEPRNIVPVEWVSEVICHLLDQEEAHGKTFHLAPDNPITPRQVVEYGYEYFNSTGVKYQETEESSNKGMGTTFEAKFLENIKQYEPYDHTDPQFDRSNLLKYAPHLPCPEIDRYVVHRYFEFGEANRWGKAKKPRYNLPTDPFENLEQMRTEDRRFYSMDDLSRAAANQNGSLANGSRNGHSNGVANGSSNGHRTHATNGQASNGHTTNGHGSNGHVANGHSSNGHNGNGHKANGHATNGHAVNGLSSNGHADETHVLGLDICGQGGGQWHLVGNPDAGYQVRLGLPIDDSPVLHLATDEFRKLVAERQEPSRRFYLNMNESDDTAQYDRIVNGVVLSMVSVC